MLVSSINFLFRFLVAVAMAMDGKNQQAFESTKKDIRAFLIEGIHENLYQQFPGFISQLNNEENNNNVGPFTGDIFSFQSTLLLEEALLFLSSNLQNDSGSTESLLFNEADLLKLLCGVCMSRLSQISNRNGCIFKKHRRMFFEARYQYCVVLGNRGNVKQTEMRNAWRNLSNLTLVFCEDGSEDTLGVQRKVYMLFFFFISSKFIRICKYIQRLKSLEEAAKTTN